jgi:hypothetical protein
MVFSTGHFVSRLREVSLERGDTMKRVLLLTLMIVLLCGCPREPETVATGTKTLAEDEWHSISLELIREAGVQVSLKLEGGPPIDAYFVDEANMNKWVTITNGNMSEDEFEFYPELSLEGLSIKYTSEWCTLQAGSHYLILDNGDLGRTMPPMNLKDDTATVWYGIVVK